MKTLELLSGMASSRLCLQSPSGLFMFMLVQLRTAEPEQTVQRLTKTVSVKSVESEQQTEPAETLLVTVFP